MDSISNNGSAFANAIKVDGLVANNSTEKPSKLEQEQIAKPDETSEVRAGENTLKGNASQADTNTREVSPELNQAVAELSDFARQTNLKLAFSIDEQTDKSVVTVKDQESGDVIRQIPSQELLDIAAQMKQITSENGNAVGLLVNGKY
ncbi:flagellar protein FlaG [Glaciecola sp. KUL10]|uniref:flagellar protein FlaG n=1 Tax=Glaciecola sp. (strain KUL10) TaxID=2161813 RepID=UPI000D78AB31|nr:flagellar protein FlaG [Glaciecola sp. KUL10]GBL04059.1 flagellar protein FlaG [Glaciecola sp. KUL10]